MNPMAQKNPWNSTVDGIIEQKIRFCRPGSVKKLFEELGPETQPIAAASLGQVYRLKLKGITLFSLFLLKWRKIEKVTIKANVSFQGRMSL